MTGADIALDILDDHQPARKGAERPAGLRHDRFARVRGIVGRVELDNQFADVVMIKVLRHLSCAMNQRGGHDDAPPTFQLH